MFEPNKRDDDVITAVGQSLNNAGRKIQSNTVLYAYIMRDEAFLIQVVEKVRELNTLIDKAYFDYMCDKNKEGKQ